MVSLVRAGILAANVKCSNDVLTASLTAVAGDPTPLLTI